MSYRRNGRRRIVAAWMGMAALLGVLLFRPVGSMSEPAPGGSRTPGLAAAPSPRGQRPAVGLGAAQEAGAARRPVQGAASMVTVVGRCVDARAGVPLGACRVALRGSPIGNVRRWKQHVLRHGEPSWTDPGPQVTADDGRFAFRLPAQALHRFSLRIHREGHVDMRSHWRDLAPGTIDLGDVPMLAGCAVRGRAVDVDGLAVAGARISLHGDLPTLSVPLQPTRPEPATSDENGYFVFAQAFPPGRWQAAPSNLDRHHLAGPVEVRVHPFQTEAFVTVVFRRDADVDAVRGTVLDDRGQPVPGAVVEMRSGLLHREVTDERGRFAFVRPPPEFAWERTGSPLRIRALHPGYGRIGSQPGIEWGAEAVRLLLARGPTIRIEVKDGSSGAPIERFRLQCLPETEDLTNAWSYRAREDVRRMGRSAEVSVATGRNALRVFPEDDRYVVSDLVRFEARYGAPPTIGIELHRPTTLQVSVQGPDGMPVAGSAIELIDPSEFTVGTEPLDLRTDAAPVDGWGAGNLAPPSVHLLLDEGVSDDRGRTTLCGPADRRLVLRVTGKGHEPVLREVRLPDPRNPLILRVPPRAPRE